MGGSALKHPGSTALPAGGVAALSVFALAAVAGGALAARVDGFGAESGTIVLGGIAALGGMAVISAGPMACLLTIVLLASSGFQPVFLHAGDADITVTDFFYAGLVMWWVLDLIARSQGRPVARPRAVPFGQVAAVAFLLFAGFTLFRVASSEPGSLNTSATSWLRLVQSASIAWLAADIVRTPRQVRQVVGAVVLGAVIAVIASIGLGGVSLDSRSRGWLGPNIFGLVCGTGLVLSALGGVPRAPVYRIGAAAICVFGLVLAQSVASIVAVSFALALGAALMAPPAVSIRARTAQRGLRVGLALVLASVVVLGIVQQVRPEAAPDSEGFRAGSATQRAILATAGLEIFERNPIVGVGWRGSNDPAVIGSREIAVEVRRRFPSARPIFYPDVNPTSVHNLYVQLLADLGLVGFTLFFVLAGVIGLRTVELVRRLGRGHELWRPTFAIGLTLLLLLIWHNDNPLYGGQTETVVPVIMIGTLAAIARMTRPQPERRSGGQSG